MGHLGKIRDIDLVGDCGTHCHGKLHVTFAECLRAENRTYGDSLRILVRHLDTDSAFPRNRSYDSYAEGGQRHRDIILQALYLGDTHPFGRDNFVESHRRTHGSLYFRDGYAVIVESLGDAFLVLLLLLKVHTGRFGRAFHKEIKWRTLITRQFSCRIEQLEFLFRLGGLLDLRGLHLEGRFIRLIRLLGLHRDRRCGQCAPLFVTSHGIIVVGIIRFRTETTQGVGDAPFADLHLTRFFRFVIRRGFLLIIFIAEFTGKVLFPVISGIVRSFVPFLRQRYKIGIALFVAPHSGDFESARVQRIGITLFLLVRGIIEAERFKKT